MPVDTSRPNPDIVWGIPAIANVISLRPTQLYPLVLKNKIKGVKKVNGRYCGHVPTMLKGVGAALDDDAGAAVELNGINGIGK